MNINDEKKDSQPRTTSTSSTSNKHDNDDDNDDKQNDLRKDDVVATKVKKQDDESSPDDDSDDDSDEDDELVLDGVVVRNPDVSSSSDDDDEEEEEEEEEGEENVEEDDGGFNDVDHDKNKNNSSTKQHPGKRKSTNNVNESITNTKTNNKKSRTKKKNDSNNVLNVEFVFCDMDEKFFHGIKSLLNNSSTAYKVHSSLLSDIMIDNISVGTVVSTTEQYSDDGTVFGFASIINVSTYQQSDAIQYLKNTICLNTKYVPKERYNELQTILSGTTKRPAGFLLHSRMMNLPMELVSTLHEQLVHDVDWAIEHAEGGIEEQKSLDFGIIIRIAPCTKQQQQEQSKHSVSTTNNADTSSSLYYKYFDDEILAGRADFTYTCPAPTISSSDHRSTCNDNELLCIMILTKDCHRQAIQDIKQMVGTITR